MKSEPDTYSIDDFAKEKKTLWDGIRNYQARNFMMKDMQKGDAILFYHSNATPPGVAGIGEVSSPAVADPTQFDKKSKYYFEKATLEKPSWFCVEVKYKKKFKNYISLDEIRETKSLKEMLVIKKGQRLSIQPVTKKEYEILTKLGAK